MGKTEKLQVDFERLQADINACAEIGRSDDDHGIYRMAFSEADMTGRRWLLDRLKAAGLSGKMDAAGNVIAGRKGANHKPSLLIGSHLDTVPAGGALDGALGVLVALECLRRLEEENIHTEIPVEIIAFSDEEGRFGGFFGSKAFCGDLTPEAIRSARDLNGMELMQAMADHRMDALNALQARRPPETLKAYLELHIEQGPVLDRLKIPIGIVTSITGLFRWGIRLLGAPDHAGTTPMPMRRDAFSGLAEFSDEIPRILEENGSEQSVATIGRVDLFPGTANTVPGRVDFSLDVRDPDADKLNEMAQAVRKALSAIARRRDLMFEFDIISEVSPVSCDQEIIRSLTATAKRLDLKPHHMPSGAGHDAQIVHQITPVGMIFVPSKDGRSHSPAEWTHWKDIETGANLMLNSVLEIAGHKS